MFFCDITSANILLLQQFHCRFDFFFETTRYSAPDVVTSAQWCFLYGLKRHDRSTMPSNIEVAGPNHEEPLESLFSDDPIQSDSKISHDKENEDQASHQSPAQASERDTPAICNASTSSFGHMYTMSKAMAVCRTM